MPPALHPRSRMTMSLFSTTLAISFLVVATPHVLPCPVPAARADAADPDRPRRRRRCQRDEHGNVIPGTEIQATSSGGTDALGLGEKWKEGERDVEAEVQDEGTSRRVPRGRECPVPKPGGLVGQILGIPKDERGEMPRVVRIEPVRRRRIGREQQLEKAEDVAE
ncbi:uncharacterized protein BDZ99DRAFT_49558 [Mytilinidion resinicola]|uniref:Alpha-1,3-mannosyltransferase n=1 Tax=Mytilinidion resinicola TaxID=574789 RepID=A0A6A6YI68_9PEZI|nr:uncharacterized protein BDZ99DRAFT_49558 [Mytilinidion resinicola]KAF2808223.1 hypothetical protein BDZ99DRAFT_49558 [Mytilinidion resinicola]